MTTTALESEEKSPAPRRYWLRKLLLGRMGSVGLAMAIVVCFAIVHLFGWRDDTGIISGTFSSGGNQRLTAMRGALYALCYFGAVVVSPILVLTAGIQVILCRVFRGKGSVGA